MDKNQQEHNEINSDIEPLINKKSQELKLYWYRWYILLQFALFSLLQTWASSMWSPIVRSVEASMNFSQHDFDLLADWSVIGVMCFIPVNMWMLVKYGMRVAVVSGMFCVFLGCGIKCLPLPTDQLKYAIHAGQILNGIGGSPVLSAPTYISNTWFPARERVFATGAMMMLGNLGGTAGYMLGPYLVEQPNNSSGLNGTSNVKAMVKEIKTYLYINFGFAFVVFFMMVTFFPSKPPSPPSASAAAIRLNFLDGLKKLLRKRTYWVNVVVFSMVVGSFYAWIGIMPLLYTDKASQKVIGMIGAITGVLGTVVGIAYSWLADRVKRYMSIMLIVTIILSFVAALYLVIMTMGWIDASPFCFTIGGLWASVLFLGTLIFAVQPIAMEIAAETAFPVSEGTSNYILMWFTMVVNVIFFSSLNLVSDQKVSLYMLLGFIGAALPLLYFTIPHSTPRLELDESEANT
ncbi:solute carrier family 49 member 4-like [Ciona intestinalis]